MYKWIFRYIYIIESLPRGSYGSLWTNGLNYFQYSVYRRMMRPAGAKSISVCSLFLCFTICFSTLSILLFWFTLIFCILHWTYQSTSYISTFPLCYFTHTNPGNSKLIQTRYLKFDGTLFTRCQISGTVISFNLCLHDKRILYSKNKNSFIFAGYCGVIMVMVHLFYSFYVFSFISFTRTLDFHTRLAVFAKYQWYMLSIHLGKIEFNLCPHNKRIFYSKNKTCFKGSRTGYFVKVSLWYASLLTNTRFRFLYFRVSNC